MIRSAPLAGLLLGLTVLVQPCAAQPSLAADIEQGHALAQSTCARCHAVERSGKSPNRRAPPFRSLSGRFVEHSLLQRLTEIAETGHYDMPPVPVHTDEIRAIAAYLNSLEPDEGPPPARPPARR